MVPERQQLLLLLRLALQQAPEQEALHLQGPLVRLPGLPRRLLLRCNLRTRALLEGSSGMPAHADISQSMLQNSKWPGQGLYESAYKKGRCKMTPEQVQLLN